MFQYSKREFDKVLRQNGFHYVRNSGSHSIYENDRGKHISVPPSMNMCVIRRLIRENNLIVPKKYGNKQQISRNNTADRKA